MIRENISKLRKRVPAQKRFGLAEQIPPLFVPTSKEATLLRKKFGYRLSPGDVHSIINTRTAIDALESGEARILDFIKKNISGGELLSDEIADILHITQNVFVRRSARLTGTALMRLTRAFKNYSAQDMQKILSHITSMRMDYPEFMVFCKFLKAHIPISRKRKNLYEK